MLPARSLIKTPGAPGVTPEVPRENVAILFFDEPSFSHLWYWRRRFQRGARRPKEEVINQSGFTRFVAL
jgi:hypothetical protein